jgi:hypothetical protein
MREDGFGRQKQRMAAANGVHKPMKLNLFTK